MAEQNNRIQFLKDALKNLSSAVREVSNGLIDLEKVISRLSGKTREFAKEQQAAAQSVNRVGKNLKDTAKTVDEYGKNTEKASKSQKGLFGGLRKNLRTIVQFYGAYQVLNLAVSAFRELIVGSAKRAIELEKALKDVAAVANLTSKDMDRLETIVFKVAGTTSLTAIEVVALQKELAKLGTSVSDIEKLTGPIALLSQALGEDAGGVAATLKKTLNQFQATSTESERFSNILLGAVNESALSLNDLGTALGYVGPLGAQLGVSFEETAALLGILADNGFKASKAGTGLRSFFIAAAKDGRPFNEFLEDVGDRSLDATEAVQTFGKIAASQALVLGKNVDAYKELADSLGDTNRLLKANADQMSSTQGQIDLLSSAYNRASIRLGDFITQTEFFIELIELLDPATAGQARAFKLISNASSETEESLDKLGKSLINFKETEEEAALSTQQVLFETLKNSGAISEESAKVIEREIGNGREVLEIMQKRAELVEYAEDELLLAEALLDIYGKSAKTQRDLRIEEEARNENYKEAEKLTNKLTQSAKDGLLLDQEQERVTKALTQKLTQLQETRENSTDKEEIIILEKRIALFEELQTKVKNLENSQEGINEREKQRLKSSLELTVEAIKNQQKVIEGLGDSVTTEQYMTQIDVLNALFGDLESIKKAAIAKYGEDSEFAKFISDLFSKTLSEVQVAAAPDPFGDITLDTSLLESFNEDDVDGVTKVAKTAAEKIRDAFKGVELGEVIAEGLETAADAISNFNDTALENTKNRLDAEKSSIENRYSIEQDILKAQLDNQLITESQFRAKQAELQKAKIAKENSIDKKIFESEKKRDRQNASTDYLQAIAAIIPTLIAYDKTADPVSVLTKAAITGALATAAYGAELAAIGQRKFFPKQFEQGGMVSGPSHAEGGVPFTVQGQGGYEMEGGEFIVNKRAASMHRDLLERINNSQKVRPLAGAYKFAQGGLVAAQANESVDYLKAIAEATTSSAIQASKPVRAFVSSKDLRSNETERRLRDRNDRI